MPRKRGPNGRFLPISRTEKQKAIDALKNNHGKPITALTQNVGLSQQALSKIAHKAGLRPTQEQRLMERRQNAKKMVEAAIRQCVKEKRVVSVRGFATRLGLNRELVESIFRELKNDGWYFSIFSESTLKPFAPTATDRIIVIMLRTHPDLKLGELAEFLQMGKSTLRKRIAVLKQNSYLPKKRRGYKKS